MAMTRVFRSGNSQAVRIPRGFHLPSGPVEILRRGDEIVLRTPPRNLSQAFELLAGLSKDFLSAGRRQPRVQQRARL